MLRTTAIIIACPLERSSRDVAGYPGKSLTGADSDRYGWAPGLWGNRMIRTPLFGAVLTVAVATGPLDASSGPPMLTAQQKMAATAPLVRSATECIVRAVAADPRYGTEPTAKLGELIVASRAGAHRAP